MTAGFLALAGLATILLIVMALLVVCADLIVEGHRARMRRVRAAQRGRHFSSLAALVGNPPRLGDTFADRATGAVFRWTGKSWEQIGRNF